MDATLEQASFDFTHVDHPAHIALYDDLQAAPRITRIEPATTTEFIEKLTTTIYEQSKLSGSTIPYSVIREVAENFIHAHFNEIVVSILDGGNTIRFADQGPGIEQKEKAQQPGFSSAIEPMKEYIRGVGSGLPIVKDYLDNRNGSIVIEDNLVSGAVVTISLLPKEEPQTSQKQETLSIPTDLTFTPHIPLSDKERLFLTYLKREGALGVTDIKTLTDLPNSTIFNTFKKLEEAGLVENTIGKKRELTDLGAQVAASL